MQVKHAVYSESDRLKPIVPCTPGSSRYPSQIQVSEAGMSTSSAVVPDSDLEQPASDSEQPQLRFDIDESFENAVNADVFGMYLSHPSRLIT